MTEPLNPFQVRCVYCGHVAALCGHQTIDHDKFMAAVKAMRPVVEEWTATPPAHKEIRERLDKSIHELRRGRQPVADPATPPDICHCREREHCCMTHNVCHVCGKNLVPEVWITESAEATSSAPGETAQSVREFHRLNRSRARKETLHLSWPEADVQWLMTAYAAHESRSLRKVYVVTSGEYSDYAIRMIFSTKEKAEKYIETRADHKIEEWQVDPLWTKIMRDAWISEISLEEGKLTSKGIRKLEADPDEKERKYLSTNAYVPWGQGVSFMSQEHADKLAIEVREEWLRSKH